MARTVPAADRAVLGELTTRVRDWSTDPVELRASATDRSGLIASGTPLILIRAHSIEDVQETVRFAATHRIPIVTRGAGTGLAGGATAIAGQIVLDLSPLNRIVEIRAVDQVAVVEPGVITADLDAAARKDGLFYAPDPGSVGISTIGGNIATNAGGLRGAKYGVTRDAVLALDVVLADGELVRFGHETSKGVAGTTSRRSSWAPKGRSASSLVRHFAFFRLRKASHTGWLVYRSDLGCPRGRGHRRIRDTTGRP